MRRFLGISATFLVVTTVVLLIIGCGGSDDDTTGPGSGTLSKDDQFESLDQFVNMDFESDDALFDINDIVTEQAASPYWDGVDSADVMGGAFVSPAVQGLGKIGQLQNDTLVMAYDDQSGWWSITYNAQDDFFGIAIDLSDSVRFETLDGTPQRDPDASTYRVTERGSVGMNWTLSDDEGSFSIVMDTDVDLDVTGLNTSVVTVAGGSSGLFDFDVVSPDTSVFMDFEFDAQNNNVTVPGPNPGLEACPNGGSASASFSVSIDVYEGSNHESASGVWDANVQFLGAGRGTITVESGDFSHSATGDICD